MATITTLRTKKCANIGLHPNLRICPAQSDQRQALSLNKTNSNEKKEKTIVPFLLNW